MSYTVENLEKSMAKITITVDADAFEEAMVKSYNKNKKNISIQGFRKGKAPRKMVEKLYGPEVFYEDAANFAIPDAYEEAAKESGLEIVSRPEIDVVEIEKGKDFIFTATVAVKPEVTLGDYKGIEVEKKTVKVMAADVNAEIDKVREQNSRMITVENRGIKKDDRAVFFQRHAEIAVGVFDGVVDNIPENARQNVPVQRAHDGLFRNIDLRLDAALGKGGVKLRERILESVAQIDRFRLRRTVIGNDDGIGKQFFRQFFHRLHAPFDDRKVFPLFVVQPALFQEPDVARSGSERRSEIVRNVRNRFFQFAVAASVLPFQFVHSRKRAIEPPHESPDVPVARLQQDQKVRVGIQLPFRLFVDVFERIFDYKNFQRQCDNHDRGNAERDRQPDHMPSQSFI